MKNFYLVFALFLVSITQAQNAADMDMDFNPFTPPENQYLNEKTIDKIFTQPDGKLITISGKSILRFGNNQSDSTFDTGIGFSSNLYDAAVQPDGKIIVVGGFYSYNGESIRSIIRLNPNGSRDTSFALVNTEDIGGHIDHVNLLPDGKILISGGFEYINNTTANGLVRLNSDGTRDVTFTSAISLGTYDGTNLHLQADNKILVSKKSVNTAGTINQLCRLNSDGSIDNTFTQGIVYGGITDFTCQSDGKIVVIGGFISYNSTTANSIVRINEDGSIDTSFNTGAGFYSDYVPENIIAQPDGKLIICGNFPAYNNIPSRGIVRLTSDGSLDPTFNVGAGFTNGNTVTSMVLVADGKIVAGGDYRYYDNFPINFITRINSDGSHDSTFTNFSKGFDDMLFTRLTQQPDGKILIAGSFGMYNDSPVPNFIRLNTDGTIDPTFQLSGTGLGGSSIRRYADSGINAIVVQPDGKILICGNFTSYDGIAVNRIMRLNNDGSRDTSFNSTYSFTEDVVNIIVQPDGKILANQRFSSKIVRLSNDGSLDTTFSSMVIPNNSINMTLQEDGKILVAGSFSVIVNAITYKGMLRLNSDGTQDTSYHLDFLPQSVYNVEIQPDGHILIILQMTSTTGFVLKRLNPNGTTDSSFTNPFTNPGVSPYRFIILSNGKLLVLTSASLERLNHDGTIDNNFDYDQSNGLNGPAYQMLLQSDQKVLFSGQFTKYKGMPARRILRLMGESAEPLAVQDFAFDSYFTVYPNPANDQLHIEKKENIEITSLSVFNTLGKLIMTIPNAQKTSTINVSSLRSGNYFLIINSDKGISNTKFIKL